MRAGPPFNTDDPEPVDYHHWEFYIASEQQFRNSEIDASLPHFEVNFGVVKNVQLHVLAPLSFVHTSGGTSYGYGVTELGVKYRFLEESDSRPQIGTFPLLEIPKTIGQGHDEESNVQIFIPLWLQKSWGKLTTYGGAGFWYNPGNLNRNFLSAGWLAQYDLSDALTLGGELFLHTADTEGGMSEALLHLGGYINLDQHNHLLFCLGPNVAGGQSLSCYLGYQLTI